VLKKAVSGSALAARVCTIDIQHARPVLNNSRRPQVESGQVVAA
jgi:hypothetical protein